MQLERQAAERRQNLPQLHVERAASCQVAFGSPEFSPELAGISLGAAAAMAVVLSLLSLLFRRDRPVTSLKEIQSLVPVPIVGVVSLK
jgi:ABC-type Fe3+-siderophore transport system permease subunit